MSEKTFFLGLGGQKCGSSWIQAYLNRQQGADFGRLGEYQIWEGDLGSVFTRYRVAAPGALETLRAEAKRRLGMSEPAHYLRWRLQNDRSQYFAYFEKLLAQPGITMTGDITPSYAALPAPLLAKIKDGFEASGTKVKVLFSMRDPVARIRSQYRMDLDKGNAPETDDFEAGLRDFYPRAEAAARSRYDMTLTAIEEVFAPEDRFLCLFEELFTPEGIAALAEFAGVPVEAEAGGKKVNARGSAGGISDELTAEIARHYAPVYQAVAERLPQITEAWPSARFLTSA